MWLFMICLLAAALTLCFVTVVVIVVVRRLALHQPSKAIVNSSHTATTARLGNRNEEIRQVLHDIKEKLSEEHDKVATTKTPHDCCDDDISPTLRARLTAQYPALFSANDDDSEEHHAATLSLLRFVQRIQNIADLTTKSPSATALITPPQTQPKRALMLPSVVTVHSVEEIVNLVMNAIHHRIHVGADAREYHEIIQINGGGISGTDSAKLITRCIIHGMHERDRAVTSENVWSAVNSTIIGTADTSSLRITVRVASNKTINERLHFINNSPKQSNAHDGLIFTVVHCDRSDNRTSNQIKSVAVETTDSVPSDTVKRRTNRRKHVRTMNNVTDEHVKNRDDTTTRLSAATAGLHYQKTQPLSPLTPPTSRSPPPESNIQSNSRSQQLQTPPPSSPTEHEGEWQFEVSGGKFQSYSAIVCVNIERAYTQYVKLIAAGNNSELAVERVSIDCDGVRYAIHFKQMTQTRIRTKEITNIRRRQIQT